MLSELFQHLLTTGLSTKLVLEFSLIIVIRYITHHDTDNIIKWVWWGTLFLIVKDIIGGVLGLEELFHALNIVTPLFILLIFTGNSHPKNGLIYG